MKLLPLNTQDIGIGIVDKNPKTGEMKTITEVFLRDFPGVLGGENGSIIGYEIDTVDTVPRMIFDAGADGFQQPIDPDIDFLLFFVNKLFGIGFSLLSSNHV